MESLAGAEACTSQYEEMSTRGAKAIVDLREYQLLCDPAERHRHAPLVKSSNAYHITHPEFGKCKVEYGKNYDVIRAVTHRTELDDNLAYLGDLLNWAITWPANPPSMFIVHPVTEDLAKARAELVAAEKGMKIAEKEAKKRGKEIGLGPKNRLRKAQEELDYWLWRDKKYRDFLDYCADLKKEKQKKIETLTALKTIMTEEREFYNKIVEDYHAEVLAKFVAKRAGCARESFEDDIE